MRRWFVDERSKLQSVNTKLEEELLEILEASKSCSVARLDATAQISHSEQDSDPLLQECAQPLRDSEIVSDETKPPEPEKSAASPQIPHVSPPANTPIEVSSFEQELESTQSPTEVTSPHIDEEPQPPPELDIPKPLESSPQVCENTAAPAPKEKVDSDAIAVPAIQLPVYVPPVLAKRPALEVYHEVHISTIRLQKFVRGYLVRVFRLASRGSLAG
ncbi:hypothetical protein FI667_g12435, partial [Globisporangium splendens]